MSTLLSLFFFFTCPFFSLMFTLLSLFSFSLFLSFALCTNLLLSLTSQLFSFCCFFASIFFSRMNHICYFFGCFLMFILMLMTCFEDFHSNVNSILRFIYNLFLSS